MRKWGLNFELCTSQKVSIQLKLQIFSCIDLNPVHWTLKILVRGKLTRIVVNVLTSKLLKASHGFSFLLQSLQLLPLEIDLIRQSWEHHKNTPPLLCWQGIPTQYGRYHNANKLAGGGDGSVRQRAKPAYSQEDEILANSTAATIQKNIPCCLWILSAESNCLKSTGMGPSEHVN